MPNLIMFSSEWQEAANYFAQLHEIDLDGAKFKIGQRVRVNHNPYITDTFVVRAVNCVDNNLYEYLVSDFPYLLWENELEAA